MYVRACVEGEPKKNVFVLCVRACVIYPPLVSPWPAAERECTYIQANKKKKSFTILDLPRGRERTNGYFRRR